MQIKMYFDVNRAISCTCNIKTCNRIECILANKPYNLYRCALNKKIILSLSGEIKGIKNINKIITALNNILCSDAELEQCLTATKLKKELLNSY